VSTGTITLVILFGILAMPAYVCALFYATRTRNCKTYHPDMTHEQWEENINGI